MSSSIEPRPMVWVYDRTVGKLVAGVSPSQRPLDRPGALARVAPFALSAAVAVASVGWPANPDDRILAVSGMVLTALIAAAWVLVPWARLPSTWQAVPAFAFFPVIELLRHAAGGASSGFSPLLMLPFFWICLYGNRRLVALAAAASAGVLIAPILAIGAPDYPATEWRRVVIWMSVMPIVGFTVRALVEQVGALARIDPLTGALNRRAWDDHLGHSIAVAERSGVPLSLAILDLDHFKSFNDTHGHLAGDVLLRELAENLRECVREADVVARFGGEEFVILFPSTTLPMAAAVVERALRVVPGGQTVSVGLAEWKPHETTLEVVGRADAALYRAKSEGRARVVCAS